MQTEINRTAPDPVWEQMASILDEALASLGETDRQAILLRFFENKDLAEVGKTLKTSEDTARKRVARALERLRKYFSRRGVVSTSAMIAAGISANSVQATPITLAKSVSTIAVGKGAAATVSGLTLVKGTLKLMTWIKYKTIIGVSAGVLLMSTVALTVAQNTTKRDTGANPPPAVSVAPKPKAANMPAIAVANADEELSPSNILAKVALAYVDLSTYRDTGWTVHETKEEVWTNTFSEVLGTRNRYRVEVITGKGPYSRTNEYFSDGLDNYWHKGLGTIFASSYLNASIIDVSRETALPAIYFNTMWDNIFAPAGGFTDAIRQPDERIDTVDCYVLVQAKPANLHKLWIGKRDFLIRRCQHIDGRIETHENIVTNEMFTRADYIPAGIEPNLWQYLNEPPPTTPVANTSEEPSASNIMTKVAFAYANLSTYRDTGWTVHGHPGNSWTNTFTEVLGLRTCFRAETITPHPVLHTNRYFSDGLKQYGYLKNGVIVNPFEYGWDLVNLERETSVPATYLSLSWENGNIIDTFRFGRIAHAVRQPDERVGDVDCYLVTQPKSPVWLTVWVGKQDFLMRRCRYADRIETHENIVTNEMFTRADYIPEGIEAK